MCRIRQLLGLSGGQYVLLNQLSELGLESVHHHILP
jgi:hypothetical protein